MNNLLAYERTYLLTYDVFPVSLNLNIFQTVNLPMEKSKLPVDREEVRGDGLGGRFTPKVNGEQGRVVGR